MSIAFIEPNPTLPPWRRVHEADPQGEAPTPPPRPTATAAGAPAAATPPAALAEAATQAVIDQAVHRLRAGRLSEAQAALQQLARLKPQHAAVRAHLGLALRQSGRLEQAALELEEATRLAPQDAGYYHQLALTCRMLGRMDEARRAFERAIEIDPEHAGALIGLGLLHDRHYDEPALAAPLYLRGAALLPAEAAIVHRWLNDVMRRCALGATPGAGDRTPPKG